MNLETTMQTVQHNMERLFTGPVYPDDYIEKWGQFYRDHECLWLISYERFLKWPYFWIKTLGVK